MTSWPDRDRRQRLFGHREIGIDRIELLQRGERRADRGELSEVGVAQPDTAVERRPQRLLRDDGPRPLDCRCGRVAGRERRVEGRLRGIALGDERLLPRQRRLGVLQLRKAVGEVVLLDRIVEIDEKVAGLDVAPGIEMDRRHDARDLGRDENALIGAQRADRGQFGAPLLDLRRLGGHSRRLRRERGGDEALDHHRLDDELEIGEPARQCRQESQRDHEHHRPANLERQRANDEQRRENGGGRAESERRQGSVKESKLRRRAERNQRHGKQKQQPVG